MQTAGKILKQKRQEKGLNLEQVEKKIKIKQKYLKLLEEDNFDKLLSEIYARGFIKNYAEFLGLSSAKILALFRRQFKEKQEKSSLLQKPSERSFFQITPKKIKKGLILILLLLFFSYLFKQYQFLTQGPSLTILEPIENRVVSQKEIIIKGKTDSDSRVFINNQEIYPDNNGEFSQEISLSQGLNEIIIFAENFKGKQKTITREITFEPL
ncbi:helix-turn-helix domain-containing protein [Candidatus Microgenomates bacterium]|nr:helix-turn-helix domain-containing protein [Candidatus Microgenomates bacterium]